MISVLFNTLFFLIPLIFYKGTSELFEFNKIIILYSFTVLIVFVWIYKSIIYQKIIFRRTILDTPLILYLLILLLSTIFSIDPRSSWLGYYSRFNGGLVSQFCYAILYWAFVSNITAKQSISTLYYILISTAIASVLAVLEHFGIFTTCALMGFSINESCWVQDVQSRVFSTLGQPNWLAALLVALLPIIFNKFKVFNFLLFTLFFATLLFTKSRSGLLAFGFEFIIFWGFVFWQSKLKFFKEFLIIVIISSVLFFIIQSPFTVHSSPITTSSGPALEVGGTESGTIREYVWLGAINIFKNYPILGTGPETFAFAFSNFKPIEHNLTSEWDFIYNKAHNEFLNTLANTGILGFLSYLVLIVSIFYLFIQKLSITNYKLQITNNNLEFTTYNLALMSGFASILVTNFFGFSVVPVSLLFFLFPAITIAGNTQEIELPKRNSLNITQWGLIIAVTLTTYYILYSIYSYWQADVSYNNARNSLEAKNYKSAYQNLEKAIKISPNESLYKAEYARLSSDMALGLANENDEENAKNFVNLAVSEAQLAIRLSPVNINNKKILSGIYYKFALFDQNYLNLSEFPLIEAINISKNDPKLYYQLGIIKLKNNKINEAIINLEKSIELKPNYKEARFALGLTYIDTKNYPKAIEHLEYSLQNIDPNDELTKKYLQEAISNLK